MLAELSTRALVIALDSVVLMGVVVITILLLRRSSAALRCQILAAGFAGLLLLPIGAAIMPVWHLPLFSQVDLAPTAGLPHDTASTRAAEHVSSTASAAASGEAPTQHTPTSKQGRPGWLLPLVLAGLWTLGTLAVLIYNLFRWIVAGLLIETMAPLPRGHQRTVAERLQRQLGIERPVAFLCSPITSICMVWGIRRPCVILPADSAQWPDAKLKAVLHHELTHIKRRDNLQYLWALLTCALFWFNPFVWVALNRFHYERELACDDSVLRSGTPVSAYATYLMEVAMELNGTMHRQMIPAVKAHSSNMKKRVVNILRDGVDRRPVARATCAISAILLLGLVGSLAGMRPWTDASAMVEGSERRPSTRTRTGGDEGRTPLHNAAIYGYDDIAADLLADGEDANVMDHGDCTPLHACATFGHHRVARMLLDHGADPDARNSDNRTPLHLASVFGHRRVAEMLLEQGVETGTHDRNGYTPLHNTAVFGHPDVTRLLLRAGVDVDALDDDDQTPLHKTAIYGHDEVTELLLESGADPAARDDEDRTPLHLAAVYGHDYVAELLLERGVAADARDRDDTTPLHLAAVYGHPEVARLLLRAGVDVNARDDHDRTPLHKAAIYGHRDVAELLVRNGATLDARDWDGDTPAALAATYGHRALLRWLRDLRGLR